MQAERERHREAEARYRAKMRADPEWQARRREACRAARQRNPEKAASWGKTRTEFWRANKPWHIALRSARRRAKIKGMAFDLTPEWAEAEAAKGSALSGLPFSGEAGPRAPSIDRIDSDRGYTMDNCRFVLVAENLFRNEWSDEEIVAIARAMVAKADA